ncbi:hypothetical protein MSTO_43280 [Mycobacterium stomatepiae]|uniref:Uncharacterized protein n=1 Tax=Mycobacterium stomatepiae TaxID=470076 RepID=A0A7I7QCS9_9MYCO|nr:hypothetical protein MSTO_43280 [Mycobacterium stomatepiae]
MLDANRFANTVRLVATAGGGHIIANAAPVCSVWIAVVFSQARYGAAAANIAGDDGPYQAELISSPNHES